MYNISQHETLPLMVGLKTYINGNSHAVHMAENEKRITKWQNWPTPEARGCGPIQFVAEPKQIGKKSYNFPLILYIHLLGSWKAIALPFWLLDLVVVFRSSHRLSNALQWQHGTPYVFVLIKYSKIDGKLLGTPGVL